MLIPPLPTHEGLPDIPTQTGKDAGHDAIYYTETEIDNTLLDYSLIDGTRAFTGEVGGIFPTLSGSLATKEYVDSAITFIEEFYFSDTASDIGGIYFDMTDMPTGEAESEHPTGGIDNSDGQPLVNFATVAGVPGLITLDAGIYAGSIHALKSLSGQRAVIIYYEIHTRATDTTETLIATSEDSDLLTVVDEHYTLHATLIEDVSIAATDRIIIKWFADGGTGGGNATVLLRQEGDTAAHLNVPISSNVLSQIYLRQDGLKPLLGPWDMNSQATTNVNIDSGTINGITDLAIVDGGTGASNAGDARTNLGLIIDTDVQRWDADLDTLATMQTGAPGALQLLTQAELEILDGATVTTTELNYLDGTILGTATVSNVLAVDANLDLDQQFGARTNLSTIGGGVDPAAVTDIANLDAYWRGEGNGLDETVNDHDLTATAGTIGFGDRNTTSQFIAFDGTLELDADTNYKGPLGDGDKSICFWIRTTASGNETLWGYGNSAVAGEWVGVRITATTGTVGGIQWFFGNGNVNTDAAVNDGEWHHIAIVWPADTGGTTHSNTVVYCDGVLDAGVVTNGDRFSPASGANFLLGDNPQGPATNAVWDCDEFAVYDGTALSAIQVKNIYERQRTDHITVTGGLTLIGEVLIADSLPSSDPEVSGQIWVDVGGILKVSDGPP